MEELLNKNINEIIRNKVIVEKLNNINIFTIKDLIAYSPKELAVNGIENLYIKDIRISLQINGVDLRSNSSKRKKEV